MRIGIAWTAIKWRKKLITLLLFVDFKEAFDLVDPELLLAKLLNHGLHNSAIKLFRNYLHDRKQFVRMNGNRDNYSCCTTRLCTWSASIIVFSNDMPYSVQNFTSILFADDTTLCQSNTNFDDLVMVFKRDLVQFFDWCAHNRMDVNWSKTFIKIGKPPRNQYPKWSNNRIDSRFDRKQFQNAWRWNIE
jgi:hypothetical protein